MRAMACDTKKKKRMPFIWLIHSLTFLPPNCQRFGDMLDKEDNHFQSILSCLGFVHWRETLRIVDEDSSYDQSDSRPGPTAVPGKPAKNSRKKKRCDFDFQYATI